MANEEYAATVSATVIDFPGSRRDGGEPPGGDELTTRVSSLEKRFDRFEGKLDALVKDVSEIKGRLTAMPTTWQLVGLVLAILGAAFAIIRFGMPSS